MKAGFVKFYASPPLGRTPSSEGKERMEIKQPFHPERKEVLIFSYYLNNSISIPCLHNSEALGSRTSIFKPMCSPVSQAEST